MHRAFWHSPKLVSNILDVPLQCRKSEPKINKTVLYALSAGREYELQARIHTFPFVFTLSPFHLCGVRYQGKHFVFFCFFKYLVVRLVAIIPHCHFAAWARDQANQREAWQQACKFLASRHQLMLPGFWHASLRRNWNLSLSALIHLRHITNFLSSLGCGCGTYVLFSCLASHISSKSHYSICHLQDPNGQVTFKHGDKTLVGKYTWINIGILLHIIIGFISNTVLKCETFLCRFKGYMSLRL